MIFTMAITLYTSRVVLQILGVTDFGIYNIVAGCIAMFGFISSSLSVATQRYITFELGKSKDGDVDKIISVCIFLHVAIAFFIIIVAEPIGLWFIHNKAVIPAERLNAAVWTYQFAILSTALLIIAVPLNAMIVAYEKMEAFAMISIVDAILKLVIVFLLPLFAIDRLIMYGALIFIAQLFIQSLYFVYCNRKIRRVKIYGGIDSKKIKEIASFASWSILGNVSYLTYTQGLNLLLSAFFAPVVNAARGIAVQVQGAVNSFVTNFQMAANPQITKLYASGNLDEMHTLVFRTSRLSFYLLLLVSLPVLFETHTILELWLGQVPGYSVVFLRLILLTTWINSIANPLVVSVKASGKIWQYESIVATIMLLILPISYVFLRQGFDAYIVFIVHLVMEIIAQAARIHITSKLINFSVLSYLKEVLYPIISVCVLSLIIPVIVYYLIDESWLKTIVMLIACLVSSIVAIYSIGLTPSERSLILNKIRSIKEKVR